MEEEALKKNTDCVYFLASPLTCKKVKYYNYRPSIFPFLFNFLKYILILYTAWSILRISLEFQAHCLAIVQLLRLFFEYVMWKCGTQGIDQSR